MIIKAFQVALVSLVVVAPLSAVHAQTSAGNNQTWTPLETEVSRGQMFKLFSPEMAGSLREKAIPFAFPSAFSFPHDAAIDTNGKQRQNEIFGIDISHYEGAKFPFTSLAQQNVSFVYVKATQGTNFADNTFDHNWKTLGGLPVGPNGQKITRGAYHFLSSDPKMSGKAQADSYVDYVNLHGGWQAGDLLPALDLEWDVACSDRTKCPDRWQTNHRTPDDIVGTALDFIAEVNGRIGRSPMIYTNKSFLNDEKITSADLVNKLTTGHKIWIFDLDSGDRKVELPNPASNLAHVLWQFTFSAKLASGFSGAFDGNVFKGTPDDFKAALLGAN
jgi:lysozyme